MTDGQWLFTVFAGLYLLECIRWLPGGAHVFCGAGRDWQMRRPWAQLQAAGARILLLPVLPPMQAYLITMPWPFAPCDEGVECCDPDGPAATLIPWRDLALQTDGARLRLTPQFGVRLPDEATATAWKERLRAWTTMEQTAREKDFLSLARKSLDKKALKAQAAKLSAKTTWLRALAMLIFLWTFSVITVVYRWLGESPAIMAAAGWLLILLWTQAILFFRAAGAGPAPIKHRFWKALAIAFLPQHAMRAADLLSRAQVCTAHPLAARELLGDDAWRKLASRFWKDLRHGHAPSAALQFKALEAFFRKEGITTDELEEAPIRQPGSAAYCPRCLAQFVDATALCRDCGDLPLQVWPEKH